MYTIIVHVMNEDPVVCDVEELPSPESTAVLIHNPRRRDGMDLQYLDEGVTSVMYPWHRINFIQVMSSATSEEIIGFVRE